MQTSTVGRMRSRQSGFSYAMVLAAVVVVGILTETAHLATARLVRADREAELLFRGLAYRRAIQSYYEAGGAARTYPRTLEDLVRDPRTPNRWHIRALYLDPFASGEKVQWNLVRAADGGIAGVVSTSTQESLKKVKFPAGLEKLEGSKTYAEWVFEYVPVATANQPAAAPPPASGPPVLKTN